jgi:hypothetical protein
VVNNIIQKNANGISLNQEACGTPGNFSFPPSAGNALLAGVRVEHNLIRNNNSTSLGYGNGIKSGGIDVTLISENAFERNLNIAIGMFNSTHVSVIENTSERDGIFTLFYNTSSSKFSNNRGEGFAAEGTPLTGPLGAVTIAASSGIIISDNHLEKGNHPIDDGIELGSYGEGIPSSVNVDVLRNEIKHFPANGIYADLDAFLSSYVVGNKAENNGLDGILIYESGNTGDSFLDNEAEGNAKNDCEDDTKLGPGTLGTWNRWFNNTGNSSYPAGLCSPATRHDHE